MRKVSLAVFFGLLAGCVAVAGCDDDETDGNGSSTSSSGTGGTTSGTGGSTSGTGGSTSGTGGSGGLPSASGFCAWGCSQPSDCCFGDPNCPGPYPSNPTCEPNGNWCKGAQCATTSDCLPGGSNLVCVQLDLNAQGIGIYKICAVGCQNDNECTAPQTCKGVDMNNVSYCLGDVSPCTQDSDCSSLGLGNNCNEATGTCHCEESSECTFDNVNTCIHN